MNIVWFKRDLRVIDNPMLSKALASGPIMAIYVFEPDLWALPDMSLRHYQFLKETLQELQNNLASLGIKLHIFHDHILNVFNHLQSTNNISALWSSQETWNHWTYDRDRNVNAWVASNQIIWHELPQHGVIRRLKSRDGWSQRWLTFMKAPMENITINVDK